MVYTYALPCATNSNEVEPFTFEQQIIFDSKEQWTNVIEVELFSLQIKQNWSLNSFS